MSEIESTAKGLGLPREAVEAGLAFLTDTFGEPFRAGGALIADQIQAWGWRNRIRIAEKAETLLRERGVARRIVPPDFLMPLLEDAGKISNDTLQDLWARLLVAGVELDDAQHPGFKDALKRLSYCDADFLRRIPLSTVESCDFNTWVLRSGDDFQSTVMLESTGIISSRYGSVKHHDGTEEEVVFITLTGFGHRLVNVLRLPGADPPARPRGYELTEAGMTSGAEWGTGRGTSRRISDDGRQTGDVPPVG